jgi:endonuclease III
MSVIINTDIAVDVLSGLYFSYKDKSHLSAYVNPENSAPQVVNFPINLPRDPQSLMYRKWLAVATVTDRRTVSEGVYRGHARLYETYPDWYTPEGFAAADKKFIQDMYAKNGVGMAGQSVQYVGVVLKSIRDYFMDDPLNIFRYKEVGLVLKEIKRMKKGLGFNPLPGFGPKILSLYAMYLEQLGLVCVVDAIPVDVWVQSIMISTGAITISPGERNSTLEKALRPFIVNLCLQKGWSRVDMSHAIWFNGNQNCNVCKSQNLSDLCPIYSQCRGRVSSESYFRKGQWDPSDVIPKSKQISIFQI